MTQRQREFYQDLLGAIIVLLVLALAWLWFGCQATEDKIEVQSLSKPISRRSLEVDSSQGFLRLQIDSATIQGDPSNNAIFVGGLLHGLVVQDTDFIGNDAVAEELPEGHHTLLRFDVSIKATQDFIVPFYKDGKIDTSKFDYDEFDGWELKNAASTELLSWKGKRLVVSPKTSYCFCRNTQYEAGAPFFNSDTELVIPRGYMDWYRYDTETQYLLMDNIPDGKYIFLYVLDPTDLVGQRQTISFPIQWQNKTVTLLTR